MTVIRDGGSPGNAPAPVSYLPSAHRDASDAARDRHPTTLGRHLDDYLAAVADELQARGVLTGSPQRSDPAHQLIGSIVLDCTALRLAAWAPAALTVATESLGGALHPQRPAPVVATWDENTGWCVGMHHDPAHASPRYLHPDLLPVPTAVADFVVGLALGRLLGATHPITSPAPGHPRLHLVP
jgi:hypothetical protein